MPLRQRLKARSQSPPKRSISGVATLKKDGLDDIEGDGFDDMLAPASMEIDTEMARKVINDFRSSCLNRATCCAVSGEGEPWCPGLSIGPQVQACHIVPQQHYHLYPRAGGEYNTDDLDVEESPHRLREAWQSTWSPRNALLLMSHLHWFFDNRLFSIHPVTLRIRVFVPYDALLRFNGQKALVPENVDRKAFGYHWRRTCIENMAAERPMLNVASSSRTGTSGTGTPLTARTDLPVTPSSGGTEAESTTGRSGDPSKRSRIIDPEGALPGDAFGWGDPMEERRGRKRTRRGEEETSPLHGRLDRTLHGRQLMAKVN